MIRLEAGLSVTRFRELAGISESTWYRQRARALGGRSAKGPWPQPVRDRVAAVVHAYALRYPAWGHRKIWALTIADGHRVSQRTVHRILQERGLCSTAAATRPSAASLRGRASRPSARRRPGVIASGRRTSASLRPGRAAPDSCRASSTTPPSSA